MKNLLVFILLCISANFYGQNYGTGMLLEDKYYENRPLSAPLTRGDYQNLPKSVSLKKYAPTPGSQGSFGTCAAWSSTYAGRTILEALKNNWTKEEIDGNTYSPSFVYNQIRSGEGCNNGTSLDDALRLLKEQGVVKWKDFGYDCDREVNDSDRMKAENNKILEYRDIANKYKKNQSAFVKKSLAENKPVIMAMDCPNSFLKAGELWVPDSSEYKYLGRGHGVTVIGYDDEKFGGAFEIINSWGTLWGKNGFCWIKYSDFDFFCLWAFEMIDRSISEPDKQDLSGSLVFRESSGDEMKSTYNGNYFVMDKPYSSGTLFELIVSNNEPAYVYSFGSDLTYKSTLIFPFSEKMIAYLPYKNNNVAIPDNDTYNMLDSVAGTTYYCFLYSRVSLDINDIMAKISISKGTFWDRLKTVLGDKSVENNNAEFSYKNKIIFKAFSKGKTVIPILVEIKHI